MVDLPCQEGSFFIFIVFCLMSSCFVRLTAIFHPLTAVFFYDYSAKTLMKGVNEQFEITEDYLMEFIRLNDK